MKKMKSNNNYIILLIITIITVIPLKVNATEPNYDCSKLTIEKPQTNSSINMVEKSDLSGIEWLNNIDYNIESYWENITDGKVMNSEDHFENGKEYKYNIKITTINGIFDENACLYITDKEGVKFEGGSTANDKEVQASITYKIDNIETQQQEEKINGWYHENGNTYYYIAGEMQKGVTKIGDDSYFLGENTGKLITGWVTSSIDGKVYYSESDGKLKTGFTTISGIKYYFSPEDSSMQKGLTKVGNDSYFLGEYTGKLITGWVTSSIDGKVYYSESDGKLKTGFTTISGIKYYFSPEDSSMQKGLTKVGNDSYFLGEYTGKLITGWVTSSIDGKVYYSGSDGKLKTGFTTISGIKYYFSPEDSSMQKGLTKVGDDSYFLGEYTGKLITGWVTSSIDGKVYYSGSDGKLKTGFTTISGIKYYFSPEDSSMQKGVTKVGDDSYFLGENTGKLITGWVTSSINGKVYYSESDGKLKTGLTEINEEIYFFNDDGSGYTGFKYLESQQNTYYFVNSYLKKGITTINGNDYFLGEYTGKVCYGWVTSSIDGRTYHTNDKGIIDKGIVNLDGKYYFLGEMSGKLCYGWITSSITHKIYYASADGVLQKGTITINNEYYKFGDDYSLQSGWQNINNATYYFYADGTRAENICKIAGVRYEFSSTGELQHSNIKIIADISKYQGKINWDQLWASGEIDGVILRIGYSLGMDSKFIENLREVKRLGIPYTVYHFSTAENAYEAQLEANHLINWYRENNLTPFMDVYYDIESWYNSSDGHTSDTITVESYDSIISTYKAALNNAGIGMGVYTGKDYAERRLSDYGRQQVSWIAHYATDCGYKGSYRGWQYTSKAVLPGITENTVDLSIFYW